MAERVKLILRALRFAAQEFEQASIFEDWGERRNLFAALTVLDVMEGPGVEEAYYTVQAQLNRLNRVAREVGDRR